MSRRFLLITMCLMFVLTCTLAEEKGSPLTPAAAVQQAEVTPEPETEERLNPETDFVELLLNVAREELGYTEKRNGYTKYGEWSGDPYAQWCAEFLCWSVNQVDERYGTDLLKVQYPLYSGSNVGRNWFISRGRYIDRRGIIDDWGPQWFVGNQAQMLKNEYIPQPGDWMFFTWRSGRDTDHVAMVEYTDVNEEGQIVLHTIEGNNPSKVARKEYLLTDSTILGYGTVTQVAGVTMRPGNKGDLVKQLQQNLIQLGLLDTKTTDGVYGGKTTTAIRTFQREYMEEKKASGIADMETQFAILAEIENRLDADPASWLVASE